MSVGWMRRLSPGIMDILLRQHTNVHGMSPDFGRFLLMFPRIILNQYEPIHNFLLYYLFTPEILFQSTFYISILTV